MRMNILPPSSTMKVEAAGSPETLDSTYQTVRPHIPKNLTALYTLHGILGIHFWNRLLRTLT
jgi:hypothetical protein